MKSNRCRWHLDEIFVKINGEWHLLWRTGSQPLQTAIASDEEAVQL